MRYSFRSKAWATHKRKVNCMNKSKHVRIQIYEISAMPLSLRLTKLKSKDSMKITTQKPMINSTFQTRNQGLSEHFKKTFK